MKLHRFIDRHRDELRALTLGHIQDESGHDDAEVGNHLRSFIATVIHELREADGIHEPAPPETPPVAVADLRKRQGFAIRQLIPAYAGLSVSLGELGGRLHQDFAAAEYGVFNRTIDTHIAEAVEHFSDLERARSSQVSDERLGFLAHELRNALGSASMAFRVLERGVVGLNGATAEIIRRNHRRMERLIEQTLAAASAGGSALPELHPVVLADLLAEVGASAVLERGISLDIACDRAFVVASDEHLLTSVVSNLVQNALKFSREGAVVHVHGHREGDAIVVDVADACGGLPAGSADELFAPFVQRGRDRRGVGLGLAITRDLVKALRGEIAVRDLPGVGCVFTVKLPASDEAAPPAPFEA